MRILNFVLAALLLFPSQVFANGDDSASIVNSQLNLHINEFEHVVVNCLVDMNPIGECKYCLKVERFIACDAVETKYYYSDEPVSTIYSQFNASVEFAIDFSTTECDFWRFTALIQTVDGVTINESSYIDLVAT